MTDITSEILFDSLIMTLEHIMHSSYTGPHDRVMHNTIIPTKQSTEDYAHKELLYT